jgi:hypothetical protein
MVVGDNPKQLVEKYDANLNVTPYVKYKYLDAAKIKKTAETIMEGTLKKCENGFKKNYLQQNLEKLRSMSDFEYYQLITKGMYYDEDGNAMSEKNPNGKWEKCNIGRNYCIQLILKNGTESLQAKKGDVDWDKLNFADKELYEVTWDLCHNARKPENDTEKKIYENMKDKHKYFENFKDKKDYVIRTAYWNYAFLSKNGWEDMEGCNDTEWMKNFYDKFVRPLDDDTLITIYECSFPK